MAAEVEEEAVVEEEMEEVAAEVAVVVEGEDVDQSRGIVYLSVSLSALPMQILFEHSSNALNSMVRREMVETRSVQPFSACVWVNTFTL